MTNESRADKFDQGDSSDPLIDLFVVELDERLEFGSALIAGFNPLQTNCGNTFDCSGAHDTGCTNGFAC